jgi:hypothetical protein
MMVRRWNGGLRARHAQGSFAPADDPDWPEHPGGWLPPGTGPGHPRRPPLVREGVDYQASGAACELIGDLETLTLVRDRSVTADQPLDAVEEALIHTLGQGSEGPNAR